MFSGIRTSSASSNKNKRPHPSSSSTELKYRAVDDDGVLGYSCDMTDSADESIIGCTDSLRQAALGDSNGTPDDATPKTTKNNSSEDDELMETAKAFIPVALEFGIVATTAANIHYLN